MKAAEPAPPDTSASDAFYNDELIQKAMEIFKAKLVPTP